MKTSINLFLAGFVLAFVAGCSTPQPSPQTENLLLASGFKTVAASTPAKQAHLKTLPPGKLSVVHRNGKPYYVYPDAAHNQIYVGNQSQYQSFRQYYQDEKLSGQRLETAKVSEDAAVWGCWAYGEIGD